MGRERAAALGSAGVRAIERAAGVETGEGLRCLPPAPPGTGHAGWRADTVLETTPAPALRNQALMPVWLTPA